MKRNIFILLTVFLIVAICRDTQCRIQSELTSSISSTSVAKGGTVVLDIEFTWIGDPNAYKIEPVEPPDPYLLDVIDAKQKNVFEMYNDSQKNTMKFQYILKATEPGKGRISYCAFEVTDRESEIKKIKKTQPYDITVMSTSRYLLRLSARIAVWVLALLVIGASMGTAGYLVYKSKQKKQAIISKEKSLSGDLEERILGELKSTRKFRISGETDKFFDHINQTLQLYFEQKAPGITQKNTRISEQQMTEKFGIPQKQFIEYKEITAAASRIKFSGEKLASEELDRWHKRAVKLVTFFKDQSKRKLTENQFKNINIISDEGDK